MKSLPLSISGKELGRLLKPILTSGKSCRFVSGGRSMEPFIRHMDCITIKPLMGKKPEKGDIVAYIDPVSSSVIVHRIIEKKNGGYLIKGDNCLDPDGIVTAAHIIGICVKIERQGRTVLLGLGFEKKIIGLISRYPLIMRIIRFSMNKLDVITSRIRSLPQP